MSRTVFIPSFNIVKDYYGSYKAGNDLKNLRKSVFKNEGSTSEKTADVKKVVDLEELKKLNSTP